MKNAIDKNKLYNIVKDLPKTEALKFIDTYKDSITYKDDLEKERELHKIDKIIADLIHKTMGEMGKNT